jgi:hypothetical protein
VHGTLDYDALLRPNGVRELLANVTARKSIFTNADAKHTAECLTRLEIDGCFEVRGLPCWVLDARHVDPFFKFEKRCR